MSRFSYGDKQNKAGAKLPLISRVKKFLFNLKVSLFRDSDSEVKSVRLSDRVLK